MGGHYNNALSVRMTFNDWDNNEFTKFAPTDGGGVRAAFTNKDALQVQIGSSGADAYLFTAEELHLQPPVYRIDGLSAEAEFALF